MTAPFGPVLESALKEDIQGGKLYVCKGRVVTPCFFCCMSGRDAGGLPTWDIGVAKDPVAVLIVNPTTQLVANNINSDYSHSWSPFSTINSWSIDWGDGQVSAGAWPGAGNINHPLGGYTLEGTYTITLTVTDLLGATGTDSQQVHIVSADFEAFAGCGASGVWHTSGGSNWQDVSTDTLDGIEVYDLKVNPFSVDLDDRELWAATANGLYKTVDSGDSWKPITLPDPDGGTDYPVAASVVCSPVDALEVYVLAYHAAEVWVFRTTDGGEDWDNWQWAKIGTPTLTHEGGGGWPSEMPHLKGRLYNNETGGGAAYRLWVRNTTAQTWAQVAGYPVGHEMHEIVVGGGCIWGAGTNGVNRALIRYSPTTGWSVYSSGVAGNYICITRLDDGRLCCGTGNIVDVYDSAGNLITTTGAIPVGSIEGLTSSGNVLFAASIDPVPTIAYIHSWNGTSWVQEHTQTATDLVRDATIFDGVPFVSFRGSPYIVRYVGGQWIADTVQPPFDFYLSPASNDGKEELLGSPGTVIYAHTVGGWRQKWASGGGLAMNYDGGDFLTSTPWGIFRMDFGAASIPTYGRTHLLTMSADGWFVYAAALDASDNPVVFRLRYDLQGGADSIYAPGAGSWGGVVCDPTHAETVWLFGDFGANVKLLVSDDWGDTLTDLTDAAWQGANEIVRPALPSLYDPADVIVIHHDPVAPTTTAYQTKDSGATWTSRGTAPFQPQCGERDWYDPEHLLIGKIGPAPTGANHLSWSPNEGVGWHERSGGFEVDAPVVAIQVVG